MLISSTLLLIRFCFQVKIDDVLQDDLSLAYDSNNPSDRFTVALEDVEINTQDDGNRFIPIVTINLPDNVTVRVAIGLFFPFFLKAICILFYFIFFVHCLASS